MNKKTAAFIQRNKHKHNNKDDFRTPKYLWNFINNIVTVDYDGACEIGINNLTTPLRLEEQWPHNSIVYSNPPYDSESIIKWTKKGYLHKENGGTHIMLIPNKLCQVFMYDLRSMFTDIIFLHGRVNFESPYAAKGGASMSGSIIVVQSNKNWFYHKRYKLSYLKEQFS